jgi:hypothetical protein
MLRNVRIWIIRKSSDVITTQSGIITSLNRGNVTAVIN